LHNLKDTLGILRNKNITVILSGVNPEIKLEIKKYKLTNLVSENLIFDNFSNATQKAYEIIECPAPSRVGKGEFQP
jgi:hypothetical protein